MPTQFLIPAILIIGCTLSAWIFYRVLKRRQLKKTGVSANPKYERVLFLFFLYVCIALEITIVPASLSGFNNPPNPALNIIPVLHTYNQFVSTLSAAGNAGTRFAFENIVGNILLFLPLGVFLPIIFPGSGSFKIVAVICLICSVSIELVQLILRQFGTNRTADIDDVILNTAGGMLGWLIYAKWIARYYRKPLHKKHVR